MKIILFLNKDLASNLAYNLLKEALKEHQTKIYYSQAVGNPKSKPESLQLLEKTETELLSRLPQFLKANKIKTSFEFFNKDFCSVPIEVCHNVNAPEFIESAKAFAPDLFISIRFGKIFKNEIIKVPKHGILNLHSGILPYYRGILGTLHALKEEQTAVGCTLHKITDSGIDTGEIIEIARLKVDLRRSLFWHVINLYPLGANLIVKALRTIETKKALKVSQQDLSKGAYFSLPTEKDFESLKTLDIETLKETDYKEVVLGLVLNDLAPADKNKVEDFLNRNSGT